MRKNVSTLDDVILASHQLAEWLAVVDAAVDFAGWHVIIAGDETVDEDVRFIVLHLAKLAGYFNGLVEA